MYQPASMANPMPEIAPRDPTSAQFSQYNHGGRTFQARRPIEKHFAELNNQIDLRRLRLRRSNA